MNKQKRNSKKQDSSFASYKSKYPWDTPEFREFLQNELDADLLKESAKNAPPSVKKTFNKAAKHLIDKNIAELKRLKKLNGPIV